MTEQIKSNKGLILSVKRGLFRKDDPASDAADNAFRNVKKQILERDRNTCVYCGLTSNIHQEVHHLNDDHADNSESNLVTICCLCHATQHIWFSGMMQRGLIIFLNPNLYKIDQIGLIRLTRMLWFAETSDDRSLSIGARGALQRLENFKLEAKARLGSFECDVLGDFLVNLPEQMYRERSKYLSGYFFLPNRESFKTQFNYWLETIANQTPSSHWPKISMQKTAQWRCNGEINDVEAAKVLGIIKTSV